MAGGASRTTSRLTIGDASLMPGSDALGFGPILRVSATSPDGEVAATTRLEVLAAAEQQFVRIERAAGTPASEDIGLRSYAADQVDLISGRPPRAVVGSDLLVFPGARRRRDPPGRAPAVRPARLPPCGRDPAGRAVGCPLSST